MKTGEPSTSSDATTNSVKVLLDQNNIPVEELLGSVTTYNNVDGSDSKSQQLRTSARVFKKMKLDSTAVTSTPSVSDKKDNTKEDTKHEVKRTFRPSWSQEDKNLFFEALNEFGKDFEAIHSHISTKLKKKGLPDSVIKTKDQVRHFYYRTWHKISKHLKFSEDIKKLAQELYGLINYGELRKKIGSVSEKACMKLNELIYRGHVSVRYKGKSVRIRTPICRALRRLNELDEKHDNLKLPMRISVELIPKQMDAWLKVQSMSQNPRIKASVPLHKRLHTLIRFLSCKWKSTDSIALDNLKISLAASSSDSVPEETKAYVDPFLRLTPPQSVIIEPATFNLSEYLTSNSICLNAFEERIGVTSPGELLWFNKNARKGGTKRARNESTGDKTSPTIKQAPNNTDNIENCSNKIDSINEEVINTILLLKAQSDEGTDEEVKDEVCDEITSEEIKEININIIRQGWNFASCANLSIGELYLMFGLNSQLVLEYSWDQPDIESEVKVQSCDNNEPDNSVNNNDEIEKVNEECITRSLQTLLSIAKLHGQKPVSQCSCGHVCGSASKSNTQNKPIPITPNKLEITEKPPIIETMVTIEPITIVPTTSLVVQTPFVEDTPLDTFRRPLPTSSMDTLRAQLDRLRPYTNRRGRRPRSKRVVVERRLPLLPNPIDASHQIVQMNIISFDDRISNPRIMAPTILNIDKTEHNISVAPGISTAISINESVNTNITFGSLNITQTGTEENVISISDNAVTPSRVGSPTSISNLLDMAIANQSSALENKDSIQSFAGLLNTTSSSSPSRLLKENENQWLTSEVGDFSFSSFLGHLESPVKPQTSVIVSDENHLSQDVDSQLHSLLTESSIDYVSKFADLAAQVNQTQENN